MDILLIIIFILLVFITIQLVRIKSGIEHKRSEDTDFSRTRVKKIRRKKLFEKVH